MPPELLAVALFAFIGVSVQTSVGFGAGLIFVPAATLVVGAEPAVVSMLAMIPLVGVVMYVVNTPRTPLWDAAPVPIASLLSLPAGVWLLTQADENVLRVLVGFAVLAAVVVDRISGPSVEVQRAPNLPRAVVTGLASGLMRGSTSLGGPPMVLYFHWLGGGAWRFRSRMFSSAALGGVPTLAIAAAAGVFNDDTMPSLAASLPASVLAMALGIRLQPLINDQRLRRVSMLLLVATSLLAIAASGSVFL